MRFQPLFPILLAALVCPAFAADWPTFRGADRTAVAPDTDLLEAWPADGPPLVWETTGAGRGYSSPAIAGDRIFTLGDGLSTADDADEYLSCFDRATGKQLWKAKTGGPWTSGQESWQSSRSTPTVDGAMVYVLTPFGQLVGCLVQDGREVFRVDLKQQFGGTKGDSWGYSESVTIDGNKLVCIPGGPQATVVALDKKSGRLIWACPVPNDPGAGHASIVIAELGRRRVYVTTTAGGAIGVDAKTGQLLWTYPIDQTTAVIPTPIVKGDLVFFSAGYKRGGALLRQVPGPGGAVTVEPVYPLNTDLANKHGGIVLVGDHLYGDSDDRGIPFCAELETGKIVWKERGSGRNSACVAAGDGHVYVKFSDGTVALVKADPAGYEEVSTFKVPGSGDRPSWAHPVILDGRLYLREGDAIFCHDIRAK
ncbi:MAG: PQQ-binding-like beta-propeller repeat protein [Planctomycetota bacterium]